MLSLKATKIDTPPIELGFDGLIGRYKNHFSCLPETRKGKNSSYRMSDPALGAFSVFFLQQPSFLAHQKLLNKKHNRSNAQTLFTIERIPSDNQIRNVLDPLNPNLLVPLFDELYQGLYQQGYLDSFRAINNTLLLALDGTQQLASQTLHCKNCSTQKHKNGTVTYSHKVITPVFVAPGQSQVIPLAPEFIVPQDGHDKQDSEHAASKRWLETHGHKYKPYGGVTVLGDDLYAHQPQCEAIKAQGMHFILTCKEASHSTLYEWINELSRANKIETLHVKRQQGKKKFNDCYRFIEQVPIKDGEQAMRVNWCELTTTNAAGEISHHSAFITDHAITADNVATMVENGRAHWHIENGNNNTLKTKGYNLSHNYGHGKQHLASFLLSLNILAFLFHTILQLHDLRYQAIRNEIPTRQFFFQSIRTLTTFMVFDNWLDMMDFMMDGLELPYPDTG